VISATAQHNPTAGPAASSRRAARRAGCARVNSLAIRSGAPNSTTAASAAASAQTVAADAAQKPAITPTDFSIVNQPGPDSYPISGYSWALIYTHQTSQATGQALVTMLDWLTHNGQAYAAANGYVPLPSGIQQLALTMLHQVTGPTGTQLLS
jgi:ABC-type phosphate transport system substrate-binding protein